MKGKMITAGIMGFWMVMTLLLIRVHLPGGEHMDRLKKIDFREVQLERDAWMGIYFGQKKIGYSHLKISRIPYKERQVYKLEEESYMKLQMAGMEEEIFLKGETLLEDNWAALNFFLNFYTKIYNIKIRGEIKGSKINVSLSGPGTNIKKTFPFDKSTYLPSSLNLFLPQQEFEIGKTYNFKIFDPQILSADHYIKVKLLRREKWDEEEIYVLEKDYKGIKTISWINSQGELIKEESDMGLRLLRETKEIALAKGKIEGEDLTKFASIPSNISLSRPREISYLKIEMQGLKNFSLPQDKRQKIKEENGLIIMEVSSLSMKESPSLSSIKITPDLRTYLQPTLFIQSNEPEIIQKAIQITEGAKDLQEKINLLNQWVYKNMEKIPSFSLPSAISVLKEKRGDCNEHAVLLTALLRAARIPAKMVVGLVYLSAEEQESDPSGKGRLYYHAWVEAYLNEWIPLDPTFGQEEVDATHIKLIEGEIDKQIEILQLIGSLKLKIRDTSYFYYKDLTP